MQGLLSLLVASVLAVALALGALAYPIAIALVSVFGLLSCLLLAPFCVRLVKKALPRFSGGIPAGCLRVIDSHYPSVIGGLCRSQRLTIQELRQVLLALRECNLDVVGEDLRKKVCSYGWEKLIHGCRGKELLDLDDVLAYACPIYFLKRLADLGPKDIPMKEGMEPVVYWASPGWLDVSGDLVFSELGWLVAQVVTEEEYRVFSDHVRNGTWGEVSSEVKKGFEERILGLAKTLAEGEKELTSVFQGLMTNKHLGFFLHGMSWEQVLFIRNMPRSLAKFFDTMQDGCRIRNSFWAILMAYLRFACGTLYDESSPEYDSGVALLTCDDIKAGISAYFKSKDKKVDTSVSGFWYLIPRCSTRGICIEEEHVYRTVFPKDKAKNLLKLYDINSSRGIRRERVL